MVGVLRQTWGIVDCLGGLRGITHIWGRGVENHSTFLLYSIEDSFRSISMLVTSKELQSTAVRMYKVRARLCIPISDN